jgi:hypothetical protein
MNEHFAQISVAALADPEELRLAAGRGLARNEPQPGREIAAVFECFSRANRRNQSGGDERAYAWDTRKEPRIRVFSQESGELRVERSDASVELQPLGVRERPGCDSFGFQPGSPG